jgi:hypothetical protein
MAGAADGRAEASRPLMADGGVANAVRTAIHTSW